MNLVTPSSQKPLTVSQLLDPVRAVYRQHKASGMLPTSGRFLYYELVAPAIIVKEFTKRTDGKKGRRPDQNMIDALTILRERGEIPWPDIIDETRLLENYQGSNRTIQDWTLDVLEQYEIDPWRGAAPLILCESRSLAGVLRPIAMTYRCPIAPTNGQANGFLRNDVAKYAARKVLYFGDLDFSGRHIWQNTQRILGATDWEILAITEEQVKKFNLPRIQKYDKRDKQTHEAVETEALGQERITRILRERLRELLPEPLEAVLERERRMRQRFRKKLERIAVCSKFRHGYWLVCWKVRSENIRSS